MTLTGAMRRDTPKRSMTTFPKSIWSGASESSFGVENARLRIVLMLYIIAVNPNDLTGCTMNCDGERPRETGGEGPWTRGNSLA